MRSEAPADAAPIGAELQQHCPTHRSQVFATNRFLVVDRVEWQTILSEDLEWIADPVLTVYIGDESELEHLELPRQMTVFQADNDEKAENGSLHKRVAEFVHARPK